MCTADNLYVVKGRLEGAAGSRFLTVRLTNVGDDACSAGTATKAGFRDFEGALGVKGAVSGGSGAITLEPGETAKTVIHWTDPGRSRRGLPRGHRDPRHTSGAEPQAHLAAASEGAGLHLVRVPARLRAAVHLIFVRTSSPRGVDRPTVQPCGSDRGPGRGGSSVCIRAFCGGSRLGGRRVGTGDGGGGRPGGSNGGAGRQAGTPGFGHIGTVVDSQTETDLVTGIVTTYSTTEEYDNRGRLFHYLEEETVDGVVTYQPRGDLRVRRGRHRDDGGGRRRRRRRRCACRRDREHVRLRQPRQPDGGRHDLRLRQRRHHRRERPRGVHPRPEGSRARPSTSSAARPWSRT